MHISTKGWKKSEEERRLDGRDICSPLEYHDRDHLMLTQGHHTTVPCPPEFETLVGTRLLPDVLGYPKKISLT